MNHDNERRAFEEWAVEQDLDITIVDFTRSVSLIDKDGNKRLFCYNDSETDIAWNAWQASANREGYKLVPLEPSQEMLIAADKCEIDGKVTAHNIYKAMIGACDN